MHFYIKIITAVLVSVMIIVLILSGLSMFMSGTSAIVLAGTLMFIGVMLTILLAHWLVHVGISLYERVGLYHIADRHWNPTVDTVHLGKSANIRLKTSTAESVVRRFDVIFEIDGLDVYCRTADGRILMADGDVGMLYTSVRAVHTQ